MLLYSPCMSEAVFSYSRRPRTSLGARRKVIQAALTAYITFYDRRGGGIETSLKGDKQGLELTKRNTCWFLSALTT